MIDFVLPRGVQAHQPLERRRLVRGVVVDVRSRVALEVLHREVDERLEGALLLGAVDGPKRPEPRLAVLDRGDAEEVLQALVEERVSFHVEEQVTGRWLRQPREPAARLGRQEVVAVFARLALDDLQRRLLAQRLVGVAPDARRPLIAVRAGQLRDRGDPDLAEPRNL